jgi:hypothetical protein
MRSVWSGSSIARFCSGGRGCEAPAHRDLSGGIRITKDVDLLIYSTTLI